MYVEPVYVKPRRLRRKRIIQNVDYYPVKQRSWSSLNPFSKSKSTSSSKNKKSKKSKLVKFAIAWAIKIALFKLLKNWWKQRKQNNQNVSYSTASQPVGYKVDQTIREPSIFSQLWWQVKNAIRDFTTPDYAAPAYTTY